MGSSPKKQAASRRRRAGAATAADRDRRERLRTGLLQRALATHGPLGLVTVRAFLRPDRPGGPPDAVEARYYYLGHRDPFQLERGVLEHHAASWRRHVDLVTTVEFEAFLTYLERHHQYFFLGAAPAVAVCLSHGPRAA